MLEYELFQARQAEMHRDAAHQRKVYAALRARREQRRLARAAEAPGSGARSSGGITGNVGAARPAV